MRVVLRSIRMWFGAVPAVLACGLTPAPAAAQLVGPEIPIWVDPAISAAPQVAFNSTYEEFLVVWFNHQGGSSDIFARRVLADGTLSSWFAVYAVPGELHAYPVVAYNAARNEYMVAWYRFIGSLQDDVLAARVSADGSSVVAPIVISDNVDVQMWPTIAANPQQDEYLVSYTNRWAGGGFDIDAQRVSGDGVLLSWANIESGPDPRYYSSAAHREIDDKYLIVYNLLDPVTTDWTVVGKLANHDLLGVSVAPEIEISTMSDSGMPVVAAGPGGFLVVWYDGTTSRPWARRIAPDGTPLGPGTGFPVSDTGGSLWTWPNRMQSVAQAPPIGYVVAWYEETFTVSSDVRARLVSPAADVPLGPQVDIEAGPDMSSEPSVACAPWGTCLVAYQNEGNIAAKLIRFRIFADGFDETGDPSLWSTAVP